MRGLWRRSGRLLKKTRRGILRRPTRSEGHAGQGRSPASWPRSHDLDPETAGGLVRYLGIAGSGRPAVIDSLFTNRMERGGGYEFVKSWGSPETPSIVANSSDREVRIPGIMKPHSVAMHPSPTRKVVVGWRSPMTGLVRLEARAVHAHPECGNGLTWALELRRDAERRRLRAGEIDRGQAARIEPVDKLSVRAGDLISLLIGPRGDHACDLTEVDLTIRENGGQATASGIWRAMSPVTSSPATRTRIRSGIATSGISTTRPSTARVPRAREHPRPDRCSIDGATRLETEERTRLAAQLQSSSIKGPTAARPSPDTLAVRSAHLPGRPAAGAD